MQPYDPFQRPQAPQQPQFQQPYPGYAPPPPRRSAIPKVIGILMIIFGGLALLGGLWGLVVSSAMSDLGGLSHGEGGAELKAFMTFSKISNFLGLGIGFLELYAGIALVTYKAKGIKLAVVYAISNMGTTLIAAVMVFAWLKPALDRHGFGAILGLGMMLGTVISLAWPTVVLALVTRPNAKAACTGF